MKTVKLLALMLFSIQAGAQYHSFGFGTGSSAFRGETTATGKIIEEPGLNLYVYYSYWLPSDERWQIIGMAHLDYIHGKRASAASDGGNSYDAHSYLVSTLGGIRYYADRDITEYVPEKYQGGVFAGLYVGPALAYSNYVTPSVIDPLSDTYKTTPTLSFNALGEIGYRMFWNQHWAYEASLGLQSGFNDRWDGMKGNSGVPDFILQFSIGASYSFYAFGKK